MFERPRAVLALAGALLRVGARGTIGTVFIAALGGILPCCAFLAFGCPVFLLTGITRCIITSCRALVAASILAWIARVAKPSTPCPARLAWQAVALHFAFFPPNRTRILLFVGSFAVEAYLSGTMSCIQSHRPYLINEVTLLCTCNCTMIRWSDDETD